MVSLFVRRMYTGSLVLFVIGMMMSVVPCYGQVASASTTRGKSKSISATSKSDSAQNNEKIDTVKESWMDKSIYNAVELAKMIGEFEKKLVRDTTAYIKKVLPYLIWYTNSQDDEDSMQVFQMMKRTQKYPLLRSILKKIFNISFENLKQKLIDGEENEKYKSHVKEDIRTQIALKVARVKEFRDKEFEYKDSVQASSIQGDL